MSIPSFYFENEDSVLGLISRTNHYPGIHTELLLETIFLKSIELNYVKPVLKLIQCGLVDPSIDNNKAIKWACSSNHVDIVKLLLANEKVDPAVLDNTIIRNASSYGYIEIVKLLLANEKVDPAAVENEAIRNACRYNRTEVAKLLLSDKRVNPSSRNNDAICFAFSNRNSDIVHLLMENERFDSFGSNFIFQRACECGYIKIVELLLADERINQDANGITALLLAMKNNKPEIIKILLESPKIDLNSDSSKIMNFFEHNHNGDIAKLIIPYLDMSKVSNDYLKRIETEMKENTEEKKMGKVMDLMKDTGINGLIFDETGNITVFKKSVIVSIPR